jgi:hypothetical protein
VFDQLLITAASDGFSDSVQLLVASINANWPGHPPIMVYDLGLKPEVIQRIEAAGAIVRQVPPFCPHWRKHFTWKVYAWNDAPARQFIYMDAGFALMAPLEELFTLIGSLGYLIVPNYFPLEIEASDQACEGVGINPATRNGRASLGGGFIGFDRLKMGDILREAFELAQVEDNIKAFKNTHRHDQALINLLLLRHFGELVFMDGRIYAGWPTPHEVPGQKLWLHRQVMVPRSSWPRLLSDLTPVAPIDFRAIVRPRPAVPPPTLWSVLRRYFDGARRRIGARVAKFQKPDEEVYDGIREGTRFERNNTLQR